jgi:hypothetical protein
MAPHVPVPDVVRVSTYMTLYGQECETAIFFRRLFPPIDAFALELLVTRIGQQWEFNFKQQLGSDLVIRTVVGEDLTPGSTLSYSYPVTFGTSFQGISYPGSIAISFRALGPALPRPWQWIYRWPGVPRSRAVGDTLDPVWAEGLRLSIRDRYTLQGAFGWRWSVIQKVISGVPLAVGVPHDVTGLALASPYVAPMRRRLTPL